MRARLFLSSLALLGAAAGALTAAGPVAADGPPTYRVHLYGKDAVPPGPDAHGEMVFTVDTAGGKLCYDQFTYQGPGHPDGLHIHRAPKHVPGPVVADMKLGELGPNQCVAVDPKVLQEIVANPAGHYANLHTHDYPLGAARGQLAEGGPLP